MAKPIEPTPTLSGEDAKAVLDELENPSYDLVKEKFLEECTRNYNLVKNK